MTDFWGPQQGPQQHSPVERRFRWWWIALPAIGLVGLLAVVPSRPVPAPLAVDVGTTTVTATELWEGLTLRSSDSPSIEGRPPEISASCYPEMKPSLYLSLVRQPDRPPPLRGVFADMSFDNGSIRRVEMSWMTKDGWIPRDDAEARRLVEAMTVAKSATVRMPTEYAREPFRWSINGTPKDRKRFLASCRRQ